jgi:predicted porin
MFSYLKTRFTMNSILILLFVTIITLQTSAQDLTFSQQENDGPNRFYIDLVGKSATLNGGWGLFGGLRAGYNINNNVSVGLVAHGLIPEKLGGSYINRDGRDELHLGYGGLEAAYNYNLSDNFYLTGILMIGAGRVDYQKSGGDDYFFIIEPGASLNYRLADWFGLGLSAGYRFASGVKYADFSNASVSGWSSSLDFKFGF